MKTFLKRPGQCAIRVRINADAYLYMGGGVIIRFRAFNLDKGEVAHVLPDQKCAWPLTRPALAPRACT